MNNGSRFKSVFKNINKLVVNKDNRSLFIKFGYLFILIIFIPLLFPSGRSFKYTDLKVGTVVTKKVIAPFTFSVLKTDEELAKDRAAAISDVAWYFTYNDSIGLRETTRLKNFLAFCDSVNRGTKQIKPKKAETDSVELQQPDQLAQYVLRKYYLPLTTDKLNELIALSGDKELRAVKRSMVSHLSRIYRKQLINVDKSEIKNGKIIIISSGVEEDAKLEQVVGPKEYAAVLDSEFPQTEKNAVYHDLLGKFVHANTLFNSQMTEERRQQAIAEVPLAKDLVYENERIIDANERVTDAIYQKLRSLEVAQAENSSAGDNVRNFMADVGKFLLTALILALMYIFLMVNRPAIFSDSRKVLLIMLIIFLQVSLGMLMVGQIGWSAYVIPTTIGSMLFGILFDAGIGYIGTAVTALLLGGILGFDYAFTLMAFFVGVIAIYSVAEIRNRNQIFKAILYIGSGYAIVLTAIGSLRYEAFDDTARLFIYFVLPNAILSPFITYMALGLFERLFDITTDVTLLELSDMNNPLLKRLASEAPGTFHHSIIVGNLAESAAKAIGANSLLARVGSYYHDIGKMTKAEYFIENQKGGTNRHETLTPSMSALVLSAHVKNGLEMAEKHGLPKRVSDFIPEHHGTNLMSYFWSKAKEQDDGELSESDFRYPGPKPQSRETAIVMMADTIEAATRTLKNPSPGRMRKMVEELVQKRYLEGELDDCNLTMRDLKGIIEGFMSVLTGIYHDRIEYPEEEKKKDRTGFITDERTATVNKANGKSKNGN